MTTDYCANCGEPIEDDGEGLGFRTPEGELCHQTDERGACIVPAGNRVPAAHPIAASDWDRADAIVANENDACYVNVAEGPGGWYLSVSLDCNSAHFTDDLCVDDGPYETRERAVAAGRDAAITWFMDNGLPYDGEDQENG